MNLLATLRIRTLMIFTRLIRSLLLICLYAAIPDAHAIPAFAEQVGQPCSQCHVGAFGPQLKPYGRDFKLYGYTASDGEKHLPGIAITLQSGFTHTADPQPDNAAAGLKANNNVELDQQASLYFGGAITKEIGAFAQVTYDGTAAGWFWDNTDIRYAHQRKFLGEDSVIGITVNNSPAIQDAWNSSPVWRFPYNSSAIAQTPAAAALLDGGLSGQVIGVGGYLVWNDTIYAELTAYQPLSNGALNHLGNGSSRTGVTPDTYDGLVPYGRLAWYHDTDDYSAQVGVLALSGDRFPAGNQSTGSTDRVRDVALDANYQYRANDDHYVSAHAIWLHESLNLQASALLGNAAAAGLSLDTRRADLSYSYRNSFTPTLQVFQTQGSADPWWGTVDPVSNPGGSPNSRGWLIDLAYVPLGKPDSVPQWANARIGLQWVTYQQFDGTATGASGHNTLYLSLWLAVSPTFAMESH